MQRAGSVCLVGLLIIAVCIAFPAAACQVVQVSTAGAADGVIQVAANPVRGGAGLVFVNNEPATAGPNGTVVSNASLQLIPSFLPTTFFTAAASGNGNVGTPNTIRALGGSAGGVVWLEPASFGVPFASFLVGLSSAHCIESVADQGTHATAAGLCGSLGFRTAGTGAATRFAFPAALGRGSSPASAAPYVYIPERDADCIKTGEPKLRGGVGPFVELETDTLAGLCGTLNSGAVRGPTSAVVTRDGNVLYAALTGNFAILRVSPLFTVAQSHLRPMTTLSLVPDAATLGSATAGRVVALALHGGHSTEDDLALVFAVSARADVIYVARRSSVATAGEWVTTPVTVADARLAAAAPHVTSLVVLSTGAVLVSTGTRGVLLLIDAANTTSCPFGLPPQPPALVTTTVVSYRDRDRPKSTFTLHAEPLFTVRSDHTVLKAMAAGCAAEQKSVAWVESAADQEAVLALVNQSGIGSPYALIGAFASPATDGSWLWMPDRTFAKTANKSSCPRGSYCGPGASNLAAASDDGVFVLAVRTAAHPLGAPGTWQPLDEAQLAELWGDSGNAVGVYLCRSNRRFTCNTGCVLFLVVFAILVATLLLRGR